MSAFLDQSFVVRLDGADPFSAYCSEVAAFCPFLKPAAAGGLLLAQSVTVQDADMERAHATLFEALVPAVESFRVARRSVKRGAILCLNLVIDAPSSLSEQGRELICWPVWLAKQIYTDKAIVFGFFWKGEVATARNGMTLPVPPVNFISIRSKVPSLDQRFFTQNPDLLQPHIDGQDDGANVHERVFPGAVPDLTDPIAIRQANYYSTVSAWGREIHAQSVRVESSS
jgi:hypothetical protein